MGDMADYYNDAALLQELYNDGQQDEEQSRRGGRYMRETRLEASEIKRNKFYVGSKSALKNNWGHDTLEAAVDHATKLIDQHESDQFIVKIVRLVRRKKAPVEVKVVP